MKHLKLYKTSIQRFLKTASLSQSICWNITLMDNNSPKNNGNMIRLFALILLLVELTSCSQYKSKTAEFCHLDKIDSVRCYSHFKNKEVTINDTNVLNKINNCLKRSVLHHDERFVKTSSLLRNNYNIQQWRFYNIWCTW